jgi:hypothetical protein
VIVEPAPCRVQHEGHDDKLDEAHSPIPSTYPASAHAWQNGAPGDRGFQHPSRQHFGTRGDRSRNPSRDFAWPSASYWPRTPARRSAWDGQNPVGVVHSPHGHGGRTR